MFGKLINNEIVFAPEKILQYNYNNQHICAINPTKNDFERAGYKEITYQDITATENINNITYYETQDNIIIYNIVEENFSNGGEE